MSVITSINNNKTKLLGIATTVLGFIQAYPGLRDMMSASAFGWTMFVIGIGVSICGFLNSNPATAPGNTQNGFASHGMLRLLIAISLTATVLTGVTAVSGCTQTTRAYKQAESLPNRAYVAAEHYFAVLREARTIVNDPITPPQAKERIQAAVAAATPWIVGDPESVPRKPSLRALAAAYEAIPSAATATELQTAVDNAARLVADLLQAVRTARSPSP